MAAVEKSARLMADCDTIGSGEDAHELIAGTVSLDEEIGSKRNRYTIASGLDPLVFRGELPAEDFTPRDKLGGVSGGGGNEWWHGTPDVVEANQAKYLK